jgi:hypothetical protein
MMPTVTWTDNDTEKAKRLWEKYEENHDISGQIGRTAGIDPVSGRIWFGRSAKDIVGQRETEGLSSPLYCVRIGSDYYLSRRRLSYRLSF